MSLVATNVHKMFDEMVVMMAVLLVMLVVVESVENLAEWWVVVLAA